MNDNSNHDPSVVSIGPLLHESRAAFFRSLLCRHCSTKAESSYQGLGNLSILCKDVEYLEDVAYAQVPLQTGEVFNLSGTGRIYVESRLATHIVSRLLGMPSPILPRALSRVEHGVLGCVVASVFNDLGIAAGLELPRSEAQSQRESQSGYAFQLQVNANVISGTVFCLLSPSMVESAWQSGHLASLFSGRTVTFNLEIARTILQPADMAVLCVGDAIVFEDVPAVSEIDPWSVTLGFSGVEIPAMLNSCGELQLKTASQVSFESEQVQKPEVPLLASDRCAPEDAPMTSVTASNGLPIELIVELSTTPLAGDSFWSLLEGKTISLGIPRSARVQVRSEKHSPVLGELISFDGMLAVRLKQKFRALTPIDQTTRQLSTT